MQQLTTGCVLRDGVGRASLQIALNRVSGRPVISHPISSHLFLSHPVSSHPVLFRPISLPTTIPPDPTRYPTQSPSRRAKGRWDWQTMRRVRRKLCHDDHVMRGVCGADDMEDEVMPRGAGQASAGGMQSRQQRRRQGEGRRRGQDAAEGVQSSTYGAQECLQQGDEHRAASGNVAPQSLRRGESLLA